MWGPTPRHRSPLDLPTKPGGFPNYNNRTYIDVSDRYLSDTIRYARAHPAAVAGNFETSLQLFFQPVAGFDRVCGDGAVETLCDVEFRLIDGQVRPWRPTSISRIRPGPAS